MSWFLSRVKNNSKCNFHDCYRQGMVMDQVDAYEMKAEMSDPCLLRIQGAVFLSVSNLSSSSAS